MPQSHNAGIVMEANETKPEQLALPRCPCCGSFAIEYSPYPSCIWNCGECNWKGNSPSRQWLGLTGDPRSIEMKTTSKTTRKTTSEKPELMIEYSPYQKAIFEFVKNNRGSAIVIAVAGSGKTTTLVQAVNYVPVTERAIFLAFNKKIVEELSRKLPAHVPARTTHSLAFAALSQTDRRLQVPPDVDDWQRKIIRDLLPVPEMKLRGQIVKLLGLAKAHGVVPAAVPKGKATGVVEDTPEFWSDLIENHSIDFASKWEEETSISRVKELLAMAIDCRDRMVNFDDMLYLAIVYGLAFPKFDRLFIDEAQDLNLVQHELIRRVITPQSSVIAVGDPAQAIYGFRGAMNNSMERLKELLGATELPLSICYRCSKNVVMEAKRLVPYIEYAPDADAGIVRHGISPADSLSEFTPDAVVLCPFNAPLIAAAYALIGNRVPCRVLGRDLGQGLIKLVQRFQRGGALTVADVETALKEYFLSEYERLLDEPRRREALIDRCETLKVFLRVLPATEKAERVREEIDHLFVESNTGMLTLSTIHKGKGLEWPKVFLLDSDFLISKARIVDGKPIPLLDWEITQRRNSLYVAITRARIELVYIESQRDISRLRD